MKFRTEIETTNNGLNLEAGDAVVLLGSCFSNEIGKRMACDKFNCLVNPFGTLYNPLSIAQALEILLGKADETAARLSDSAFKADGQWYSWVFGTGFSADTCGELLQKTEAAVKRASSALLNARLLAVTFGTSRAWSLGHGSGYVVANCHRQPAGMFEEQDTGISQAVERLGAALNRLFALNSRIAVVFTVSPYRYLHYGMHSSNVSKAKLMLVAEELVERYNGRCCYFPSFEILNDELRDYRFYAPDMVHPSQQAADYIYTKFADASFSGNAQSFVNEWGAVAKTLSHRPSDSHSAQYLAMMRNTLDKINCLAAKYPQVDFHEERNNISQILSQEP